MAQRRYRVEWQRRAERRLGRLPQDVQDRVLQAAGDLATNPRGRGVRQLRGPLAGHYRIQVGIHYRVVYTIADAERVVTIVNVGSREQIY